MGSGGGPAGSHQAPPRGQCDATAPASPARGVVSIQARTHSAEFPIPHTHTRILDLKSDGCLKSPL